MNCRMCNLPLEQHHQAGLWDFCERALARAAGQLRAFEDLVFSGATDDAALAELGIPAKFGMRAIGEVLGEVVPEPAAEVERSPYAGSRVLVAAFNKRIASELNRKLGDPLKDPKGWTWSAEQEEIFDWDVNLEHDAVEGGAADPFALAGATPSSSAFPDPVEAGTFQRQWPEPVLTPRLRKALENVARQHIVERWGPVLRELLDAWAEAKEIGGAILRRRSQGTNRTTPGPPSPGGSGTDEIPGSQDHR